MCANPGTYLTDMFRYPNEQAIRQKLFVSTFPLLRLSSGYLARGLGSNLVLPSQRRNEQYGL
jgi:hypothetical protein